MVRILENPDSGVMAFIRSLIVETGGRFSALAMRLGAYFLRAASAVDADAAHR
ncbi:MAG TPA: hypothetical protein VFH68_16670 [Polyangia bacterium]|jgi:hypothetical protein|nr:hypothetical protein [Polyangia bacterium]